MKNDTISRQAAIAYAISGMTREIDGDKWIRVSEVRESIKTMPSAERRGQWISQEYMSEIDSFIYTEYKCSNCGEISKKKSNYCSNCGAKMNEVMK